MRVKGKDEPVAVYEPLGLEAAVCKARAEEPKLWAQALQACRSKACEQAELVLFNLQRLHPAAPLYSFYSQRVARYRADPPPRGCDGVTAFETK